MEPQDRFEKSNNNNHKSLLVLTSGSNLFFEITPLRPNRSDFQNNSANKIQFQRPFKRTISIMEKRNVEITSPRCVLLSIIN